MQLDDVKPGNHLMCDKNVCIEKKIVFDNRKKRNIIYLIIFVGTKKRKVLKKFKKV